MAATTSRKSCRRCFSQEIPLWLAYSHPEYHPAASDVVYYICKNDTRGIPKPRKALKEGAYNENYEGCAWG